MTEPVLHQWELSPFCGKVRKILRLKAIAFRVVNYNGLRAIRAGKLSPAGKLPVFDWGEQRVADSSVIAAFVEQSKPLPAIFPADARRAAIARRYDDWAGASLYPYAMYFCAEYALPRARAIALLCEGRPAWEHSLFGAAFTRHLRRKLDALGFARREGPGIEASFLRLLDDLDTSLRDREWLVGDAQSIADISVSAQIDEIVRSGTMADRIRLRTNVAKWLLRQSDGLPSPVRPDAPVASEAAT